MIVEPELRVADFAKAGADIISVHADPGTSTIHLHRTVNQIKDLGCKAGVVLNPGTPPECLEYVLDCVDLILVMSVNPGFGGQSFIESQARPTSSRTGPHTTAFACERRSLRTFPSFLPAHPSLSIPTRRDAFQLLHLTPFDSAPTSVASRGSSLDAQVEKIAKIKAMCDAKGVNPWIEVDGGVTPANAYKVIEAGANALVAGSAVFNSPDYAAAIAGIKASKAPK